MKAVSSWLIMQANKQQLFPLYRLGLELAGIKLWWLHASICCSVGRSWSEPWSKCKEMQVQQADACAALLHPNLPQRPWSNGLRSDRFRQNRCILFPHHCQHHPVRPSIFPAYFRSNFARNASLMLHHSSAEPPLQTDYCQGVSPSLPIHTVRPSVLLAYAL